MTSKPKLMLHLVADYPNPDQFLEHLKTILDLNVDYLEIQLPFSNPVADGKLIFEANNTALSHKRCLEEILNSIKSIYNPKIHKTKLILMTYITPFVSIGYKKIILELNKLNFIGLIIPDLIFGSEEQINISEFAGNRKIDLIPVISQLTNDNRMEKIYTGIRKGQLIYVMAKNGTTGGMQSSVDTIMDFLDSVNIKMSGCELCVGFGIRTRGQVLDLWNKNYVSVIGSKIIELINSNDKKISITNFINQLN